MPRRAAIDAASVAPRWSFHLACASRADVVRLASASDLLILAIEDRPPLTVRMDASPCCGPASILTNRGTVSMDCCPRGGPGSIFSAGRRFGAGAAAHPTMPARLSPRAAELPPLCPELRQGTRGLVAALRKCAAGPFAVITVAG